MTSSEKQRITANLPRELLQQATETTQLGITDTLILGLQMVKRSRASKLAKNLQGRLIIKIDLDASRERTHR